MTPMTGIVRDGKIEIVAPSDCGEGEHVQVWVSTVPEDSELIENPSPELIAERIKTMEEFEPLQLTDDEQAVWERSIREQRAFDSAAIAQRSSKLESAFK